MTTVPSSVRAQPPAAIGRQSIIPRIYGRIRIIPGISITRMAHPPQPPDRQNNQACVLVPIC
ncbi:hypothetical protein [Mesorhizobium sp. 1M-11]|uniref:hypothetical protein n=1 Tax=Mesorhizobium sp. 1M-11 TaxID=1529006 RepID=UPI00128ED0B2|nr:hypothetical protein [Mesorhizobium sp. 1M-11]